jgi:hypothetical protein
MSAIQELYLETRQEIIVTPFRHSTRNQSINNGCSILTTAPENQLKNNICHSGKTPRDQPRKKWVLL